MDREFPDCPFERYADDGLIHCKSAARARQVLAALERRMRDVGLELHPGKTQIVYCKDSARRQSWDGLVSFDFLCYLRRHTNLTWEQLTDWIGPVICGWMAYYGRFRHSELHPLLARINRRVQQ
jgi:RNA-directed DNA polymerase